jgi:hypothetical protein
MTTSPFRARATEFDALIKRADHPDAVRELQGQQRTLVELANNEEWLASNLDKTVRVTGQDVGESAILAQDGPSAAAEEGHVLACLGAAVIMQWNTLPTKLQKELFDNASSMGELLQTDALKKQIACFLHKHKDGEVTPTT